MQFTHSFYTDEIFIFNKKNYLLAFQNYKFSVPTIMIQLHQCKHHSSESQ